MLEVRPINNKKVWEFFLQTVEYPFFQSWEWGEVQKVLGVSVDRVGLYEEHVLIGVVQAFLIKARRGKYYHFRHGPVLSSYKKEYVDAFLSYFSRKGEKDHVAFIRLSPLIDKEKGKRLFPFPTFVSAPMHKMDAEVCWVLAISPSEEELLQHMRKSHRYLIKKAQSSQIKIIKTTNKEDMEKFMPLYKRLAKRKHFVAHKGVAEEFSEFVKNKKGVLFLAKYDGKVISGALIDFVGDMAIYRHSASDEAYRQLPAMYLLQWEVIKEAKKRKMKYYNFWGISQPTDTNHPWYGLTLFKTGFGGEMREYMHAKDMPLRWSYIKTYGVEFLSKLQKGY